jgi:hypothetical protein
MNPDESPGLSARSPGGRAQGPVARAQSLGSAGWSRRVADGRASTGRRLRTTSPLWRRGSLGEASPLTTGEAARKGTE